MSNPTIARRLRRWRDKNNLSQDEAAKRFGVTTSAVWLWEKGMRQPRGLSKVAVERELAAWEKQAQAAERES